MNLLKQKDEELKSKQPKPISGGNSMQGSEIKVIGRLD